MRSAALKENFENYLLNIRLQLFFKKSHAKRWL